MVWEITATVGVRAIVRHPGVSPLTQEYHGIIVMYQSVLQVS